MPRPDDLRHLRALTFDFDGTLATGRYDFARMRAEVVCLVEEFGLHREELPAGGVLELVAAAAAALPPARAEDFRERAEAAIRAVEIEGARGGRLLPGAAEALERLRAAGYRIGVITRNCRAVVDVILDGRALPRDVLLTREDVTHVKPHPEQILTALRAMGAAPAEAAMVGDHPMDMEAAHRADALPIGVLSGHATEQALRDAGAAFIYADVVALAHDLLHEDSPCPTST